MNEKINPERKLAFKRQADTKPERPLKTKPESAAETKTFSAEKHGKFLMAKITEMAHDDKIKSFIGQLHTDDLPIFHRILCKETNNPKYGRVADLLRDIKTKIVVDTKGITPHCLEEIQQLFRDLNNSFWPALDIELPPRKILGLDKVAEINEDLIHTRTTDLYNVLLQTGKGQPQDFVRHIIGRASLQLRQELKTKKQEKEKTPPESWLDIELEQSYASLIADLKKMSHKEQIVWLGLLLETDFTEAEAEKIQLRLIESTDASKIANYQIKRPIIECADPETVVLMAKKVGHQQPERVGGFIMVGGRFRKNGLGEMGLIVTPKNPGTIKHEIRHSIEPKQYSGLDRALSEIFAYAELYVKNGEWQKLEEMVVNEVYLNTYKTSPKEIPLDMQEKFSADERALFQKEVHQAIEQLKKRVTQIGEIPALRELLTAGSLRQYYDDEFQMKVAEMATMKIR